LNLFLFSIDEDISLTVWALLESQELAFRALTLCIYLPLGQCHDKMFRSLLDILVIEFKPFHLISDSSLDEVKIVSRINLLAIMNDYANQLKFKRLAWVIYESAIFTHVKTLREIELF